MIISLFTWFHNRINLFSVEEAINQFSKFQASNLLYSNKLASFPLISEFLNQQVFMNSTLPDQGPLLQLRSCNPTETSQGLSNPSTKKKSLMVLTVNSTAVSDPPEKSATSLLSPCSRRIRLRNITRPPAILQTRSLQAVQVTLAENQYSARVSTFIINLSSNIYKLSACMRKLFTNIASCCIFRLP